jgi:hypothetical protein
MTVILRRRNGLRWGARRWAQYFGGGGHHPVRSRWSIIQKNRVFLPTEMGSLSAVSPEVEIVVDATTGNGGEMSRGAQIRRGAVSLSEMLGSLVTN